MERTGNRAQGTALATVLGIVGWIVLANGLVFGQVLGQGSTAAMSGVVRDATGAVVPETAVTARHIETGLTRTANTDAAGRYSVPSLPVGEYEVMAMKPGFKLQVRRGINLAVGQEAVLNLTLEVGQVQQTVEVTGEAPIVNTTLASTSGLITEAQVKDMPLNGRSFDQLLTLNVGTVNNTSNISTTQGFTGFSVAGKRPETNRFLLNGVDYVGGSATGSFITPIGASGLLLGVEGVREYNVQQHTYGAEYGKRAGGQITVVTSSGTNQLHGTAFEYLRNSAMDARNFFDYPQDFRIPPFKRNQFGGSLGGPLKKDKAFLFGSYEGFRQRWGLSLVANVPDAGARGGLLPCNVVYPSGPSGSAAQAARDANCGTSLSGLNAYLRVPGLATGMLPYAQYFWSAPNGPEQLANGLSSGVAQSFSNALQTIREDFGLTRFDYNLSGKDSFSVNYTITDGERITPQADPVFLEVVPIRSQTLGLQETHIFSPSLLGVSNVGFSRPVSGLGRPPAVAGAIPENLLFVTGGYPGSIILGGGQLTVFASAITPASGIYPLRGARTYFSGSHDLRWARGAHSWSAGVWVQRVQEYHFGAGQASAGNISYSTLQTFLQDRPSQFVGSWFGVPVGYRATTGAWYIQDEIKLRPNLTLRLGLRDEFTNGWNEVAGRCSNYFFDPNGVVLTDPHIGGSCLQENNARALWQPRVGIAWDPTGTGSWAVRAGFGIHNDLQDNLGHRVYANPPINARFTSSAPLLTILKDGPIDRRTPAPPSCHAVGETGCAIFQPGGLDPNMHTPTIQQWSFTVERGITRDLMLQLSYVGMESYHVQTLLDMNTPHHQVCTNPTNPKGCESGGVLLSGAPFGANLREDQKVYVQPGTTYIPPGTRLNPFVSNTTAWFYLGTANYHSGNVSLVKRATRGVTFKANYSFSKIMDLQSANLVIAGTNEPANVVTPHDLKLSRGPGSYSLTHQFNGSYTYQLPFGKGQRFGGGASGWADKLIGGWQWNGIVTAQSGFPFSPVVGSNTSGTGNPSVSDTPNRNPSFQGPVTLGSDGFKKTGQYFDPNAFSIPLAGTFGNVGRDSFIGPKLVNFDTSLFKKISLTERTSLQFRAEAFNLLNNVNFGGPNGVVFSGNAISSTAGQIIATATSSRQIQFALKLLF